MSRCPDYSLLLEPFIVSEVDDVIITGSKKSLASSLVGDVFDCRLSKTGESAVMKCPKVILMMYEKNSDDGSSNQRWLRQDCKHDPGYFLLLSEVFPSRVLEIQHASSELPQLNIGELCKRGSDHQKWTLDQKGRLLSKLSNSTYVAIEDASPENGSRLKICQTLGAVRKHQRWSLVPVSGGAFLVESGVEGLVIDVAGGTDLRELYYLARWIKEPGIVQLRHVVWNENSEAAEFIITERLGKQLGPGTTAIETTDCVLRDISEGRIRARTPAQAAKQLLPVASALRRMHLDGYAHNDLHDGNILRCGKTEVSPFSVIDLGSVFEASHWKEDLGKDYDEAWCITRDWRAFAIHFVSLIDGKVRKMWDLIGQNDQYPKRTTDWIVPAKVSIAVSTANGSEAQKWLIDEGLSVIYNRSSRRVLDLSGKDNSTVLAFEPHGGTNQRWRLADGVVENPAKRKRLGITGAGKVSAVSACDKENQQWRYDDISCEIVNPASRKVLDMNGRVRLPHDVTKLLESMGQAADPVFKELLEALFKDRSDPNDICCLVGLLSSRC